MVHSCRVAFHSINAGEATPFSNRHADPWRHLHPCPAQGVFLFGMSEGAVTLSSFNDEVFAPMIR